MKKLACLLIALAACGGSNTNNNGGPDAAVATVDASPPDASGFQQAPHPGVPQVKDLGGGVTTAPVIVPIFFTGDDTMKGEMEPFFTAIATSDYWHQTTSEYGVGDATVHASIVATDTPPTTDDALQQFLQQNLDGTHAEWPAPDDNTIYAVYLPSGVSLSTPWGSSCQSFGGYHSETALTGGQKVIYALMPRCGGGLDALTGVTSHEFVEAATDPHPFTAPAMADMDAEHYIWADTPGAELGDMCEYVRSAEQRLVGNFVVQRSWSNASAAAGHDPCVPAMSTPYIAAAPVLTDDVSINFPQEWGGPVASKGVTIPVGQSKTIDVALFSDAETADFTVTAYDVGNILQGASPNLTFAWDSQTGNNGAIRKLTITNKKAGQYGGNEFVISARSNNTTVSLWWGFVAD
ncbi:MAG TPA: hypothetical protein VL463_01380 [Kofleriaceae bacterium]|nr:hypothetical protein [Kofleriaceae bacterium]